MLPSGPLPIPALEHQRSLVWRVPGSKSLTNRALLLAALADGTSRLRGCLESDDTKHMRRCLGQLGIAIESADHGRELVVHGGRDRLHPADQPLEVGNSGTTVRFLTALAAVIPGQTTLIGDQHMAKRPIGDLIHGLAQLGVSIDCPTGCPPLVVTGGNHAGGALTIPGNRSSQYISAILMAATIADAPTTITVTEGLVSRPYVAMTVALIETFGGRVEISDDGETYQVYPATLSSQDLMIEPDASAASYPAALAVATRSRVQIPGLTRTMLQGDIGFIDVLSHAGAHVEWEPYGVTIDGRDGLSALNIDMHHISDTAQTLAAIAPLAEGDMTITNIGNIRIKETDRLHALETELRRLGQSVQTGSDWLRIQPRPLISASVECYADHRMAMSFAVLGCAAGAVTITDPGCVAKTYPDFWRDLAAVYPERPW